MAALIAGLTMGVVGLTMGGIGMVPVAKSFIPDKSDRTTTVRIGVGTSTNVADTPGGNTPGVALFDVMGRPVGTAQGSKKTIADGSFKDIKIVSDNGVQSQYISISKGGIDALCIAYITVTWPDGGKYLFSGDTIFGDSQQGYKPKCMWIDGNDSNGITTEGFGVHITDFEATNERTDAFNKTPDLMCKSPPRFMLYDHITSDDSLPYFNPPLEFKPGTLLDVDPDKVIGVPGGNNDDKKKPSRRPLRYRQTPHNNSPSPQSTMAGRLITSSDPRTSAVELCESESSLGPDHVSFAENKFCDMNTKKLWPLCAGAGDTSACFDAASNTMRAGIRRRDGTEEPDVPEKNYHTVTNWT